MENTDVSIRSAARYLLLWLAVIALFMAALPVGAQGPDEQIGEQPDQTAKRATQVQGGGQSVPAEVEAQGILTEGFETGVMPPAGWTHLQTNPNETWDIATYTPYSGSYYARVLYDPALLDQDEVLLSPAFTAYSGSVSLWSLGSIYWCRDTYDNCDLEIWFVNGAWDWGGGDDVYLGLADDDWTSNWTWSHSTFDFSPYASGNPARIAFCYVGNDGAEISVDEIYINYSTCGDPHEPNDTPGQATPIGYGTTLTDPDICPAGDEDYYSFVGSAGDPIAVDIDAWAIGSSLDSVLYLYDTDGVTQLYGNDDYDGLDSYFEYTLPANGTYYLKVQDYGNPDGGPDYFYTISLINVGPLEYDSYTVDDDNSGNSFGNGDGIVNSGETIELYVTLYNQGSDTAIGVNATISTSDPYVTFTYNTSSNYPDIPGGSTRTNGDDFDFEVDSSAPDGHGIHFDLDITASNGGPWSVSFDARVGGGGYIYLPIILRDYP